MFDCCFWDESKRHRRLSLSTWRDVTLWIRHHTHGSQVHITHGLADFDVNLGSDSFAAAEVLAADSTSSALLTFIAQNQTLPVASCFPTGNLPSSKKIVRWILLIAISQMLLLLWIIIKQHTLTTTTPHPHDLTIFLWDNPQLVFLFCMQSVRFRWRFPYNVQIIRKCRKIQCRFRPQTVTYSKIVCASSFFRLFYESSFASRACYHTIWSIQWRVFCMSVTCALGSE